MSTSDKLFASRISVSMIAIVILLIGYVIFSVYYNEINDEVARRLNDSFGHLKGELANL